MEQLDKFLRGAVVVFLSLGCAVIGGYYGATYAVQSVEAVACEPSVVGLRKNGKEIPLTSAQRDSLSMRTR